MAISINTTFVAPGGFDMFTFFEGLSKLLFSLSSTAPDLVTFTFGLQTLSFTGTFNEGGA